jgi:GH24 family phage-related lysozyme (muramidase)
MVKPMNSSDRGTVAPAHRDGVAGMNNPAFGVYTAKIMNNVDALKLNRVQLWVPAFGSAEVDKDSWLIARPAMHFGGVTPNMGAQSDNFESVQKAYGNFSPVPDVGSSVVISFLDGNTSQAVILGSLHQDNLIHSLPGIGNGKYKDENGNMVEGPVTEHNHNNTKDNTEVRVKHRVLDDAVRKQGLETDPYRGFSSSTSQRESPSRVYGTLTRAQQQFVMDDGDADGNNRLIRLRTRNGAQILLSDSCGFVYMISRDGQSWMELGNDGAVNVFGAKSISMHSGVDVNIVAQGSVNIEGNDVNIKSRSADIRMEAQQDLHAISHGDMFHYSEKNANLLVKGNYKETAQKIDMNGPKADEAKQPPLHDLSLNSGLKQSIASVAPEGEPWQGHPGCGDGTNTNPNYNTETPQRGVSSAAATQVGSNIASALPQGQQTTLPGSSAGLPGVPAIGGQNIAGSLGGVLGSAINQVTGINTEGVLGLLSRAAANVLGVPITGYLGNPNAQVQADPDRYGEYPSSPTVRTQPPNSGASGSNNTNLSTQPPASTVPSTTNSVAPRPDADKSCEKGPTNPATSHDEYGKLLIICNELYRGTAYKDHKAGWASIGYGRLMQNSSDVFFSKAHAMGGGITEEEAWSGWDSYIGYYEGVVRAAAGGKPIPQNVFNGVLSLAYQCPACVSKNGSVGQALQSGNWQAVATAVRNAGHGAERRAKEAQLIANGCYPYQIVSKGTAKIREERTVEGIRALGNALRSPGGQSGNRGYSFATHGNRPSATPNELTTSQARRLLQSYSSDPRPLVADAAKRALGS